MDKCFEIPCTIDKTSFRDFAVFNSFRFHWRWASLLLFPVFMLVLAVINRNTGSILLFRVFLVLGLLLPAIYLFRFEVSLRNQIRANGLETPRVFYTVAVSDRNIVVWNRSERQELPWDRLYRAFRYRTYIYIYATQARVFLVPCPEGEEGQRLWSMFLKNMEKGRAVVKKG